MGEAVFDWLMENIMPWLMSAVVVLLLGGLIAAPFLIYSESKKPTFELKKEDFVCSASHQEQTTTYVKSGDAMIPIISTHDVCDSYSRRYISGGEGGRNANPS